MTPIKLLLIQLVFIAFLSLIEKVAKKKKYNQLVEACKLIGGMTILSVFGSMIWAILHYINF